MGRLPYDWLLFNTKEFPYKDKFSYVLTRKEMKENPYVKFIEGDISTFINNVKNKKGKNIWLMGGGEIILEFMNFHAIDKVLITIASVLLGNGIPLFKNFNFQKNLYLKYINRYRQFVTLHYDVINKIS